MKKGSVKKQNALIYNLRSLRRSVLTPRILRKWHKKICLHGWERRRDADYIRQRVEYYNPSAGIKRISEEARPNSKIKLSDSHSCYWYDMMRYIRAFRKDIPLSFIDGDTFENPDTYCVGKARRLDEKARNVALMKLDSRRHYLRVKDYIPFSEKKNILFFRGNSVGKPERIKFLEMWKDDSMFDIGDTDPEAPASRRKGFVSISDQFQYKYILAPEGADVASALQWICASNCVPVMCRPTVESWFMHGRMVPGIHYIEVKSDFSDIRQKIEYYNSHPKEAEAIAEASKEWARQFDDEKRESIISYLVAESYLKRMQ